MLAFLAQPSTTGNALLGEGGSGKRACPSTPHSNWPETANDDFADGVYFVPLAAVTQPDLLILSALASALALQLHERSPARTQVLDFLRQKRMLLVFDNFEHVIEGVALLQDVLEQAAGVRLLVTSPCRSMCWASSVRCRWPHARGRGRSAASDAGCVSGLQRAPALCAGSGWCNRALRPRPQSSAPSLPSADWCKGCRWRWKSRRHGCD
ncbi:MAG: hypothetical protein R2856_28895 [Caldilineaceae bacterium]